jgi:translation initiation factor IF-3
MDYGKFKYEAKKKANEAKKKQTVVKLKEVKFRPKTEEHDYNFKVKAVREFLGEGNKARITVMFRGREITHREIGQAILTRIGNELKEIAIIEQSPRLEGRLLFMILAPNPRWVQQQRALHEKALQAQKAAPAAKPHAPRPAAVPHAAAPAAPVSQAAPPPAHAEATTAAPKA